MYKGNTFIYVMSSKSQLMIIVMTFNKWTLTDCVYETYDIMLLDNMFVSSINM